MLPFVTINPSRHLQPNCRSRQLVIRDFRFWTDPFPPSNSLFSIFENTKEKMVKIATITRRRNENNKWRKRGDKAERERERDKGGKKRGRPKTYRKRIRFYFWPRLRRPCNGAFTHLYTHRAVHSGPRVNVFTYSWFYDRLVVVAVYRYLGVHKPMYS